jgi:transposase
MTAKEVNMVQQEQEPQLFVGIDWGSETHVVQAVNAKGQRCLETQFAHRGSEIERFVDELATWAGGDLGTVAVGIETAHGAVVEALLDAGAQVHSINPKQLDRFRDRHTVAGAKDDSLDAYVLADSLRSDRHLYRRLHLPEPLQLQLRELSRAHDALTEHVVQLGNQVTELLRRYYVELLDIGNWYDEPWLWALFERAPTPATLRTLRPHTLEKLLREHGIRRYQAQALLNELRAQRPLPAAPGVAEAMAARISLMLPSLRAAHSGQRNCRRQLEKLLEQAARSEPDTQAHPDAAIVLSFVGIGTIVGAKMMAEAWEPLRRRDYHALRRLTGAAPVSKRTGKQSRPTVQMRRARNPQLSLALYHWARVAVQREPRARAHYQSLRQRGHRHGRALRGVGDRLLRALVAALRDGQLYDPARRSAPALP